MTVDVNSLVEEMKKVDGKMFTIILVINVATLLISSACRH